MTDFEALEKAGHDLTMLSPMIGGVTTYYCERCGAIVQMGRSASGHTERMAIFHLPPGSPSKTSECFEMPIYPGNGRPRTLKTKLDDERAFALARLERV
jgi:hypothetical protein